MKKQKVNRTPVEHIKTLLDTHIHKYYHPDGWYKSNCMCFDTTDAVDEIFKHYPKLTREVIFKSVGDNVYLLKGKNTGYDFVWGKTDCARELSMMIN